MEGERDAFGIPVNGSDAVAGPDSVAARYGLISRSAWKVVEQGDSVAPLDAYAGIETPHIA